MRRIVVVIELTEKEFVTACGKTTLGERLERALKKLGLKKFRFGHLYNNFDGYAKG